MGNVDTIQKLTDILVSNTADLLDISSILGNVFDRVTGQDQFILLSSGEFDIDTVSNWDQSDLLVTQEVSDFNELLTVLVNGVDIDWEMRVDVSQLVLVTLGDTGDQVVNQRLDSSQSSNVLSVTVVDGNLDQLLADLGESNINVLQGLDQGTSWASNLNNSGLDADSNTFWDCDRLFGLNVLHLCILWQLAFVD